MIILPPRCGALLLSLAGWVEEREMALYWAIAACGLVAWTAVDLYF